MSDEWPEATLGDLVEIRHGYAFKGEFFSDEPPGDVLLTPRNFAIGGGFRDDKLKYYRGPVPPEFVLSPGDLLVAMTDLSKEGAILGYGVRMPPPSEGRLLHNQRLGKVTIKPGAGVDIEFLEYLLQSPDYRAFVLSSATGTTVRHTSPGRICGFRFRLPPLEHQRAIAAVLGGLTAVATAATRAARTGERLALARFRQARDGAEPRPLGDVAEIIMGSSPPGETYNTEGIGPPFFQGTRDFGFRHPTARIFCSAPVREALEGDVLASVRAPVGRLNVASEQCCIGRGLAALRSPTNQQTLFYALLSESQIWRPFEGEGTVFGAIARDGLAGLLIPWPDRQARAAFDAFAQPIDALLRTARDRAEVATRLRQHLLPRLLLGEATIGPQASAADGRP